MHSFAFATSGLVLAAATIAFTAAAGAHAAALLRDSSASRLSAPSNAWDSYIWAPASRTVFPHAVYETAGNVTLTSQQGMDRFGIVLQGPGARATLDFGQETSGYLTVDFGVVTTNGLQLGVAFSESARFVGVDSDNSTDTAVEDGALYATASTGGTFTFGREFARGSFRFVTFYLGAGSSEGAAIEISSVSSYFTAAPLTAEEDLRTYSGHFFSDNDLLNRIWYAGAYTVQLCTIFSNESRANPPTIQSYGWFNNATVANASGPDVVEVFVDGARRDRTPWAGDFGISILSKAIAWNADNLRSVHNSLLSLFAIQEPNGQFSYAGTPIAPRIQQYGVDSNTYHLWTLIALADYAGLSGNYTLIASLWDQVLLGFDFIMDLVDPEDNLLSIATAIYDYLIRLPRFHKQLAHYFFRA
ncbi:hypothetical protein HK405_003397 [Cladochytrium tenue]|nr:hypothetical protein HK405_003397 [Cladochytrium tenue]